MDLQGPVEDVESNESEGAPVVVDISLNDATSVLGGGKTWKIGVPGPKAVHRPGSASALLLGRRQVPPMAGAARPPRQCRRRQLQHQGSGAGSRGGREGVPPCQAGNQMGPSTAFFRPCNLNAAHGRATHQVHVNRLRHISTEAVGGQTSLFRARLTPSRSTGRAPRRHGRSALR